jgi:maleate cis-trans isomerase
MAYEPVLPRARLGFIIPASNRMVEPQMARFAPPGVVPHFMRLRMTNQYKRPLPELLPRILDAAAHLMDSKCDIIVFQCTGTSMSGGVDMEHVRRGRKSRKAVKRPAISTAGAVTRGARALARGGWCSFRRPNKPATTRRSRICARQVTSWWRTRRHLFRVRINTASRRRASGTIWPLSLRNDAADAYFISCANIQSIDVIEDLERVLNKPVVTSNQAALWCALRTLGIVRRGDRVWVRCSGAIWCARRRRPSPPPPASRAPPPQAGTETTRVTSAASRRRVGPTAPSVFCAAFRPSRKSLSENVANTSVGWCQCGSQPLPICVPRSFSRSDTEATTSWKSTESVLVMWLPMTARIIRRVFLVGWFDGPGERVRLRGELRLGLEFDVDVGFGALLLAHAAVGPRRAVVEQHHVVLDHAEPFWFGIFAGADGFSLPCKGARCLT